LESVLLYFLFVSDIIQKFRILNFVTLE